MPPKINLFMWLSRISQPLPDVCPNCHVSRMPALGRHDPCQKDHVLELLIKPLAPFKVFVQ